MKKRVTVSLMLCILFLMAGCSSNDSYSAYKKAYQAMSAPGSLNADIGLTLVTEEETVNAQGNMKMNKDGAMYYEMKVGDTNVIQFLKDGVLYSEVNGVKTTYDTKGKENEKPKAEDGSPQKEDGAGFELTMFLEEFASMLEAGKIKEMGLLDPIPQEVIKKIDVTEDGNGKQYKLEMPDSFVEKLFNVMIEEQVSNEAYALSFSNLKDFSCVMHVNKSGVLDGMSYAGTTDVTVPAALTKAGEETIHMDLALTVSIKDAGSKVEVPAPDTSGY